VVPSRGSAQDAVSGPAESEESLADRATDPTAYLTQVKIKDEYTPVNYGTNAQPNTLLLRPVFAVRPHLLTPLEQLIRPTIQVVTVPQGKGASTSTAFGDMQLLDLLVLPWPDSKATGFRWGIGPYSVFPTSTTDLTGQGSWQAGPAAAFSWEVVPRLKIAALMQQATSFAYTSSRSSPVTSLTFQPILTYGLGRGWYLKSSDATWTFNLRHKTSTEMPLSAGAGKVWKLSGGYALDFSAAGEWMAYRQFSDRAEQFTLEFQLGLLLPELEF
jgi:hypothetical protein